MEGIKTLVLFCLCSVIFPKLFAQCPYTLHYQIYGAPAGYVSTGPVMMGYSSDSTIIIGGTYTSSDSLNFQGDWVDLDGTPSGLFLVKVDMQGNTIWKKTLPGIGFNTINDLKCDQSGGIYITGLNAIFEIEGTLYDGAAVQAFYFARFNPNGLLDWIVFEENSSSAGTRISISDQYAFVNGRFSNQLDIFGQSWTSPTGSNSEFILQVDFNGDFENLYLFPGTGSDHFLDIECSDNRCFFGGLAEQDLYYNSQLLLTTSANNSYKYFIGQLDLNVDSVLWIMTSNECSWIQGIQSIVTTDTLIYMGGFFEEPLSFASSSVISSGSRDAFILKTNTNGDILDLVSFGGNQPDAIYNMFVDNTDIVITLGYYSTNFQISGNQLSNSGGEDAVQIRLNKDLEYVCMTELGGQEDEDFWSSKKIGNRQYIAGSTSSSTIPQLPSYNLLGLRSTLLVSSCLNCEGITVAKSSRLPNFAQIYPNPFAGQTTVKLTQPIQNGILQLHDALGRLVREEGVQGQQFTIGQGGLPAGLYFLSLYGQEQKLGTWRLAVSE